MARPTTGMARAGRAKLVSPRGASPGRLSAGMACDTAFRIIARRHLDNVIACHNATCSGDPDALHETRLALTHLRAAIRFFSPMVDDAIRPEIWTELKWLNSQLGMVRDLDVAIDTMVRVSGKDLASIAQLQLWNDKRAESHRLLARALQSARYRRLVERTASWIESGPWSTRRGKEALRLRSAPLAEHAAHQLARWQKQLLKKSHKLAKLGAEERHRVRLLNKRLTYAIESLEDLFPDKSRAEYSTVLKRLRKAQRCLGQLNDDARGRALARSLRDDGLKASFRSLGRKRRKQLLRAAATAYRKLGKAKLFRSSGAALSGSADD